MQTLSHQNIPNGTAVPSAISVIATSPVVLISPASLGPAAKVIIKCTVSLTAGTGTTAVVISIRQGTTTAGNALCTVTQTQAAGVSENVALSVEDTTAWLESAPGNQYCVTVTQTNGTANGSVMAGDLEVDLAP